MDGLHLRFLAQKMISYPPIRTLKGFTLIEVLIASAILTMSIGALLQLFSGSINRVFNASEHAQKLLIEQQIMQEIAVLNPAEITHGSGHKYYWEAKLIKELKVMPETQGEDKVIKYAGLYEIKAHVIDIDNKVSQINWAQLGWK